MTFLLGLLCVLIGYLLGTVTTGVLVARFMGKTNIRDHGSGSVGATNLLRTMGWAPSLITLGGDMLKGVIAVLIGRALFGVHGGMLAGVAVIAGHNWPVFQGFKGGKGIATSLAVVLMIQPSLGLLALVLGLAIIAMSRMVSVGSMACAVLFFAINLAVNFGKADVILFSFIICAMALFSHRDNIKRLIAGNENKLDFGKIKWFNKKQG